MREQRERDYEQKKCRKEKKLKKTRERNIRKEGKTK